MKDVVGFIKNFDIKIPHKESFEYYIETLSKSEEYNDLSEKVSLWEDYEDSLGDVSPKDAKYKTLISLVEHFKSLIGESINEYSESCLLNLEGKRKFQPEDVNFYISFDVKQGNWTVIRKALGETLPDWEKYLTDTLNIHPVLAKSKGFRQAILGQSASNKKYIKILRHFTALMLKESSKWNDRIVGINDEEIHFNLGDSLNYSMLDEIRKSEWTLPVSASLFKVDYKESFGNRVRVDTIYDSETLEPMYKRLWGNGGDGNRFYLHFKNLILNEGIDVRDALVRKDGIYFQLCGTDYKEFTEYNWVRRWVKPLIMRNDEDSYGEEYIFGDVGENEEEIFAYIQNKSDSSQRDDIILKEYLVFVESCYHESFDNKQNAVDYIYEAYYKNVMRYFKL